MRYAVFSDVHANRQAWETVLADIRQQGADVLVCLGDVVGYGPMPQAVLESIGAVTPNFVLGNHDAAVCGRLDTQFFNPTAKEVIEWTRDRLDRKALDFFNEVPLQIEEGDVLFVHAEAADPGRFGYIDNVGIAAENLKAVAQRITFLGHTHHPVVHALAESGEVSESPPMDFKLEEGMRYLVNVGSVGEPRTPDIRSSYVIYDSEAPSVAFRTLTFDVDAYRKDLAESGLGIQPYFVQVVQYGERQAAAAQQAAMVLKPNVPVIEVTRRPLLLTGYEGASPWMGARGGQRSAAELYSELQKRRRKSRVWGGLLLLLLLIGIGAGVAFLVIDRERTRKAMAGRVTESEAGGAVAGTPASGAPVEPAYFDSEGDGSETDPRAEAVPLGTDLASYWPFDNGETGSRDGYVDTDGKLQGDVFGVEGRFGDAFHFPAGGIVMGSKSDYAIGEASFAASVWFTLPASGEGEEPAAAGKPAARRLLSAGAESDASSGWAVWIRGDTLTVAVGDGEERKYLRAEGIAGDAERWRHLAVSVERSRQYARLYVDGKLEDEGLLTTLASGDLENSSPLNIGRKPDGTEVFAGKLDDLAIWSRALNDWEVDALHRRKRPLGVFLGLDQAEGR